MSYSFNILCVGKKMRGGLGLAWKQMPCVEKPSLAPFPETRRRLFDLYPDFTYSAKGLPHQRGEDIRHLVFKCTFSSLLDLLKYHVSLPAQKRIHPSFSPELVTLMLCACSRPPPYPPFPNARAPLSFSLTALWYKHNPGPRDPRTQKWQSKLCSQCPTHAGT